MEHELTLSKNLIDKTALIHGVPVSCYSFEDVLDAMAHHIRHAACDPEYICITNTESMYYARKMPEHLNYIRQARFSMCDGIGVVIAGWFCGHFVPRRNGPVLMLKSCEHGIPRGWTHFFLGGRDGVAADLARKLSARFPRLKVAGTYSPPFRALDAAEEDEMIRRINESHADIVWVGLGLPKQERWIARYRARLSAHWIVGVGAAFDYHTGNAKWAPPFFQKIGLEWLYRLLHEPRMLIRIVRSFRFMLAAILDSCMKRLVFHRSP